MKLQVKIEDDNYPENEVDLIITDEGFDNDYWKIDVDKKVYSIHGKELERLCKAFLANRQ